MAQNIRVDFQKFISAEPGTLMQSVAGQVAMPVVILCFGDIDTPIKDISIGLKDAQDVVVHVLRALAYHGDDTAARVLDAHFRPEA